NTHLTTYRLDSLNRRTHEFQHLGPTPVSCACASLTRACVACVNASIAGPNSDFTSGALSWVTSYDPNGNVGTTTDPKGQSCLHDFGLLNRLKSQLYAFNPLLSR